ncbi:filaggrin isoform X11 [Macrobrachium rosenbergii]|uniref:filaggrin isoform X11 n=1 Tax=Macrobrachium rosenbergii TaxID=79674 RepID=UPI0034D6CDDE
MRDDVPRATQALGTPPQPQRRTRQGSPSVAPPTPSNPPSGDTTGGGGGGVGVDLSRSDSYSLSRGGKLVSSRPWSAQNHHQVVVNMHLVDIQKGSQQQQQQQPSSDSCRGVSSSGASSGASSSGDSSDSSDSDDDTSEDEYEVRTPARPLDHTHYTLPEEDEEEEAEGGGGGGEPKVEETESVNKPEAKERRGDERSDSEPDDNGGEATTLRDGRPTRPQEASGKDQGAANRSVDTDGGDCDSDDDEDDSESEETESTVRARQVGVGGNGVVAEEGEVEGEGEEGAGVGGALLDGASQPPVDEDHNDTLSTLSGDLSFDDRDVTSPPREHQHHHHHHLQAVPSVPEDPDAACQELGSSPSGTTPICHNRVNSSSQSPPGARKEPSQKENSHEELKEPVVPPRRTPPEGAGVRAGVFCISGYPRSNTDNPRSDLDSSSSSSYSQQMASSDLSYKRPLDDASLKFSKTHPADETGTTVSKDENPLEKTPLYVDSRQAKRFESPDRPSGAFPQEEERSGSGLGGKKVTPQQRSSKYASGSSSSRGPHLQGTWDQQGILPPPPRPQQQKPQQKLQQKPPQKQQRKEKQRTPPLLPNGARSSPSRQKHLSPEKEICRRARSQQQQEEEEEEEAEDTDRCSSCNGNNSVDNGYSSLPRSCPSPSPSCSSSHSYRPPSRSLLQEKEIQTSIRRDLYPPTPQHHSSKQTQQRQKLAQLDTQQQLQQLRRLQHSEQEQHQRSYQRQYSNRSDNSTSTVNSRSSSSSPPIPGREVPEEEETDAQGKMDGASQETTAVGGATEIAEIFPTENGSLEDEENDVYDDSVDAMVVTATPTAKLYSGGVAETKLYGGGGAELNTGTVQLYPPAENGTTTASRLYHSDDSAVRRMYHTESGALRRMYHSLSDYGMYPAYLSGLGLSTIVPLEPGDRVCGGGTGLRSPAHQSLTTTPTPLMPRLQTTPGLSGSASRLSGGNEGVGIGLGVGHSYGGLASTRLGGSYTALVSSAASSGYGSCAGGGGIGVGGVGVGGGGVGAAVVSSTRHEDSEDLSDVSSGATSEDSARRRRRRSAQPMKGEASVSGNEDFEWVRASPMLTGLLEGHVTRLATPPDHRGHSLRTSLATPPESGEESTGVSAHRHRQYTRPPPVPRPRTLEAGDLIPHRPIRDNLRDGLRDSRDGLRDRLYSPSRDLTGHRRSRDSSIERSGRDSSCERGSVSSLHQHNHHHHHHLSSRLSQHTCECPSCWCEEEEGGYDSCDERHHHHRHSYHEGLHHAHLHQLQSHHHGQPGTREASRERRSRGQGSGDSGRSSPCCCRHCHHLGSLSSLSSHDYCANTRLALPCTSKVGGGGALLSAAAPQGSRRHRRLDSDYITLWSCHSPSGSSLEDRVHRLEGDKDSLQLQVTVLSEQVEAQTEKIQDMESLLDQKKELLRKTEEQLQKEVMTRSSLETQRLELFSEISNLKLRQAAFERENAELRDKIRRVDHQVDHVKAQLPTQMANSPSPSTISTLSTIPSSSPKISPAQPITVSPTASPLPVPVTSHDAREFLPPRQPLIPHGSPFTKETPPPNARRKIEQFGTIPRQREADLGGAATTGRTKGVMFGKGLHFLPFRVAGKRSTSAPNLAETEMQMIDDLPEGEYCPNVDGIAHPASSSPRMNALAGHRSPTTQHKTTGIKKIFTRLRRSSSGHLESDLGDGDFRRGGMRATASARLGWTSPNTIFKEPSEAFRSWNIETMEAWFGALGLSQYCAAVRTWSVAGRHMSQVTPQQLERDLGIRHPLHRKKIQLAISARVTGDQLNTPLARLDHAWVLRWLDDVGLPQYKDAFSEARIDGRVLNCLTYDDLAFLRLTNLLHVTSLKRGIQVLREHNFDPSVLKRRSLPEEDQRERSPSEVALWTNHRVMEWLRTVDLSEYAPNLRGSGVHGALMVYEVRFTSELLASLLSIPCGKTLLRRHLNTHFKELVGLSIVQEKRELEATAGYTPLTTTAKVKMPKKSQFSLKRKKTKSDLEFDDLLCPLDEKPPSGALQDKEKECLWIFCLGNTMMHILTKCSAVFHNQR